MMTNEDYMNLVQEIKNEFPDFMICKKSSSFFMKSISSCLRIISFGRMNTFMENFITTIGNTVYVPDSWDSNSASTKIIALRHERIHMRQSRRLGRIKFSLLYLFFPVPIFRAYYRTKFEKEAYQESLIAYYEIFGKKLFTSTLRENVISHFTSSQYMWMWTNKQDIEKWYDDVVACITKSEEQ